MNVQTLDRNHTTFSNGHKPRGGEQALFRIEVTGKPVFSDSAGAAVRAQLSHLGIACVTDVRVGSIYELSGRISASQAAVIAQQLLADPVTQDFQISSSRTPPVNNGAWRIEVWLKSSVSDSVGETVRRAVADLGLQMPESVRCGTVYRLAGRLNPSQAEKIAVKLLANPIIHRYSVTPS